VFFLAIGLVDIEVLALTWDSHPKTTGIALRMRIWPSIMLCQQH